MQSWKRTGCCHSGTVSLVGGLHSSEPAILEASGIWACSHIRQVVEIVRDPGLSQLQCAPRTRSNCCHAFMAPDYLEIALSIIFPGRLTDLTINEMLQLLLVVAASVMVWVTTSHRENKRKLPVIYQALNWSIAGEGLLLPIFLQVSLLNGESCSLLFFL